MAKALFILSAALMKPEPGWTAYSHMQGYRVSENEDEAKGNFVTAVMEERPGFLISSLLCMAVPDDAINSVVNP